MANSDSPKGFRPIRHLGGGVYNGGGNLYHVAVGDAQVIAPGDPVTITGTADANGIPDVARSTGATAEVITGVMIGITNGEGTVLQDASLNTVTLTSQYILVEDNPQVVFEAQMSAAFAVTDIGANANVLQAAASEGHSNAEVNSTGIATTAAHQLQILRLVRREDNEVGANAKVEVRINNHSFNSVIAGI